MNWIKSLLGMESEPEDKATAGLSLSELDDFNAKRREDLLAKNPIGPERPMLVSTPRNGLTNLGNTCFLSSALQCVMHTYELSEFLLKRKWPEKLNTVNHACKGHMAVEYHKLLVTALCTKLSPREALNPSRIKDAIKKFSRTFAGYAQQDSQEFLSFFLDALHEDLNSVLRKPYEVAKDFANQPISELADDSWSLHLRRNNSPLIDLFFGQFYTKIVCPTCSHTSITFDPFDIVSLSIPSSAFFDGYYVPYTSQSPILALQFHHLASSSVGETVDYIRSQVKTPTSTRTKAFFKRRATIQPNKEDIESLPLGRAAENAAFLFVDEIFERKAFGFVFGDSVAEKMEKTLEKNPNSAHILSFFAQLGDTRASIEREVPVPESLSLESLLTFLYFLHRKVFLTSQSKLFEGLPAEMPDSLEKLKEELSLFFPKLRYDSEKSPFILRVAGETIEDYSHSSSLFSDPKTTQISVEISLSHPSLSRIKFKLTEDCKIPNYTRTTLSSCFKLFNQPEILDNENQWYCSKCKAHKSAERTMMIYRLPKILIIHFKRFLKRDHRLSFRKNSVLVDFPLKDLNLQSLVYGQPLEASYDLFGVSNHIGEMGGGHYTAFCKGKEGGWNQFDDEYVRPIDDKGVVSDMAYLLFYRLK